MVTASDPVATEYDAFAPFYDGFTAGSDYESWTQRVLELVRPLGVENGTLLDLACGTGKSFLPFRERGFRVTACDISRAMLAQAAAKAPDVTLLAADMRELGTLGGFDLVTCFDDSLNYLLDEPDLARAFSSIAANLSPRGIALFDLNTLLAYRTTFASDSVSERDGRLYVWRGESTDDAEPACTTAARIEVVAPTGSGLYDRVSTRHVQRHFPRERVVELLASAGLDCIAVHGVLADGALVPDSDETAELKVLYVARPAKGGDRP